MIGQRLRYVSDACRTTLARASVIGREFDVAVLERVSDGPGHELLDALDEAMGARLLGEAPGPPGRLRFAHALIRDTLYEELPAARRASLHRLVAEALETLHAGDLDPYLAELAHHSAGVGARERRRGARLCAARRRQGRAAARLRGGGRAVRDGPGGARAGLAGRCDGAL